MRKIVGALLVILLLLLVIVASCGPGKRAKSDNQPAASSDASAMPSKSGDKNLSAQAKQALTAAGYPGVTVIETDGSLVISGDVGSPTDRVNASRALAPLGVPVINHLRNLTAGVTPRPLSLYMQKNADRVTARGHVTAALAQSLKQRYSLNQSSQLTEGPLTTRNAIEAVQLASRAINDLTDGAVRIAGTQIVVNGTVNGDAQAFRSALNEQLPGGFSLSAKINPTQSSLVAAAPANVAASTPVAQPTARQPVAVAESLPITGRGAEPISAKNTATTAGNVAIIRSVAAGSTTGAGAGLASQQPGYRDESRYGTRQYDDQFSDLPIAETLPLDASTGESAGDRAATTSRPNYQPAPVVNSANRQPAESIRQSCSSPELDLMPNGSIRFLHNSAKLTWKSRQRMELALPVLQRCSGLQLEIAGHTDITGTDGLNSDISRARAERIHQYLLDNGISAGRLTVTSYGDSRPAQANDTRFGRAMNRRVELVIQR